MSLHLRSLCLCLRLCLCLCLCLGLGLGEGQVLLLLPQELHPLQLLLVRCPGRRLYREVQFVRTKVSSGKLRERELCAEKLKH